MPGTCIDVHLKQERTLAAKAYVLLSFSDVDAFVLNCLVTLFY